VSEQQLERSSEAKKTPWQLILILLVTVVPIVSAYFMFYTGIGVPKTSSNKGMLLEPAQNFQALSSKAHGEQPSFEKNFLWRLFIPVGSTCNEQCQHILYVTRQVHIRLGNKADRVERYFINLSDESGQAFFDSIKPEHPRLKQVGVAEFEWAAWLEETNAPQDVVAEPYYILVDPGGYAMMFYTSDIEGGDLLKDIKKILRYSPDE